MKTFLEHVAADIIRRYGTQLNRIAVVFPNKRASLFLDDALARIAGKPIWSPAYITISDLFRQNSSLSIGDPIRLVCASVPDLQAHHRPCQHQRRDARPLL